VAVLQVGGRLAQLADPATLLRDPVDDFVADFVGRDRGYRGLAFRAAPSLAPSEEPTVPLGATAEEVRRAGRAWVLVVDDERRPVGWVEPSGIHGTVRTDRLHRGGTVARLDGSTRAVLDAALSSPSGRGVLVDDDGRLVGTVTAAVVVAALEPRDARQAQAGR
jgi:osmoprotectant transport system ATP-binding protein